MARGWKPGDVAAVTMPDGSEQVCHRESAAWRELYTCQLHPDHLLRRVLPARPLGVIDPEDREQVEALTKVYDNARISEGWAVVTPEHFGRRSNAMQAALRDLADPKPPKPEEPTGLGAVVRAADDGIWIRVKAGVVQPWVKGVLARFYADIDAVEVLSQGVTP